MTGSAVEASPPPRHRGAGCLRYALFSIAWLLLYVATLSLTAGMATDHLLPRASRDGYAAYVSLLGFLFIMPAGLLFSLVVFAFSNRWWLFLLLSVVIAAGAAFAPVLLD